MIPKAEVLAVAGETQLLATTVEKDYVLGWVLFGISAHAELRKWFFKGGTCLKKCFFETYRFSEDLDFSLTSAAPYDEPSLLAILADIVVRASELSGIELPIDRVELRARKDKLGRATFQGKIAYRGPLAMPNWPRVLLDLTQHETIVAPLVRRPIFHPYTDSLPEDALVCSYSMEELFAEIPESLRV